MNVLLIEDEQPAARRLTKLITDQRPQARILDVIDSVEASVAWLRTFPAPDLLFMDIQLADGISFAVFQQVDVRTPVIFTTAFDEFTLRAFKVNSVDYLLKPIDPDELSVALTKFDRMAPALSASATAVVLEKLMQQLTPPTYKERLLVKLGPQLTYVPVPSLAYLYSEDSATFAVDTAGKRWLLDQTLDQTEAALSPRHFFRISRKLLVHLQSIHKIHAYYNSRLKLDLLPPISFEVIVSRERVVDFKAWLDA